MVSAVQFLHPSPSRGFPMEETLIHPRDGWERVASLLVDRRVQLNPRYKNRLKFAADTGLNERLISDLENARRHSYRDTTLRAVEAAYQWTAGSIQRILEGGDPGVVAQVTGGAGRVAMAAGQTVSVHAEDAATATDTITVQHVPRWFASEAERRGMTVPALLETLTALRQLAGHWRYSLAELLLHAGLVSEDDLKVEERPAPEPEPESEALAEFDNAMNQIASSPFLTRRQRQEIEALAAQARKDAIEKRSGDV
ncbi:hypothetical protein [Microbispora sp. ATCC PTA-5024]|uniref:hypothetical protein n=1 Tax=Microbispora sp. ATCC PTA-5024 TaxID=316330 RepID=UPI0003DC1DDC|nr:hypothetical protein [Microbispora sp. ATCC PTA-5024]ETK36187.1 hypothetical protein MPTA5024_11210 [Microbispora sp. ATCC PTA-5024]